ncbi:hypothetical protein ROZALSC1DRAFT_31610 [Rozella allomycis CSF55]|uniref:dolichol kinase n=1 Tax=Rozella allomycis (strain CSF55) TaxID=988480 RepID=A0A075B318_ROZAC|nr:hypothetical protein O9G_001400 [Rozella allomycis CSF55]RKP16463.1 hypothetical protein ROZALSC1DRAFT_31610 [Rozella allomycis CSF55]|eukprot:EPZ36955.1 hypothetical protein O9G_001400 [Rozella allomycis CSF55]
MEYFRISKIFPVLSDLLEKGLRPFTNHVDSGAIIFSHISLILAFWYPAFIGFNDSTITVFAGFQTVGLCDSMASIIGSIFGTTRFKNNRKSIEGSLAFFSAMLLSTIAISLVTRTKLYLVNILIKSIITTAVEAYLEENDNIILPLISINFSL